MSIRGYALWMDGCPYLFTTAGTTISASDTTLGGLATLPASLAAPRDSFTERAQPLDGALEVSARTFKLFDVVASSGIASGQRALTWLGTRNSRRITQAALSASIDDNDMTLVVARDTGFATGGGVIWIDQEAILYSAFNSGTKTFTLSARGAYGSRARAHYTDSATGYAPFVFASFPWFTRRRVTLYEIDENGLSRVQWIGYCGRAPRLAADGITFELQCEHAWIHQRGLPMGPDPNATRISGFAVNGGLTFSVVRGAPFFGPSTFYSGSNWTDPAWASTAVQTFAELTSFHAAAIRSQLEAESIDNDGVNANWIDVTLRGGLVMEATSNAWTLTARVISPEGEASAASQQDPTDSLHKASLDVRFAPQAFIPIRQGVENVMPISRAGDIPDYDNRAPVGSTSPYYTVIERVLRGRVTIGSSEGWLSTAGDYTIDAGAGTLTGKLEITGIDLGRSAQPMVGAFSYQPIDLQCAAKITTPHWFFALKHGVFDYAITKSEADSRDWTWDTQQQVLRATEGTSLGTRRTWYLDGTKQLGEYLVDLLKANGAGLSVRAGKLAPIVFRPPKSTDPMAAVWTHADYVVGAPPRYATNTDGLANQLKLETLAGPVIVNRRDSFAKYGPARTIEIKLLGADGELAGASDPIATALEVGKVSLDVWSEPYEVITLTLAYGRASTVYIGDYVEFDAVNVPDGEGGRGCAGHIGQVIGRVVDLGSNTVAFDVIRYGQVDLAGWAPCILVDTIVDNVVTADLSYLATTTGDGPTDFAGSNQSSYRYASTYPNDGGVSWFGAGPIGQDVGVRLVSMDNGTLVTDGPYYVLSINPASRQVTLDGAPSITGSMIVMEYAVADTYGTDNLRFAFVADITSELIDDGASGVDGKRFGP